MPEPSKVPLVYLDTSVWIQAIAQDEPHDMADRVLLAAADGRIDLVGSWLLRAEVQTSAGPDVDRAVVDAVTRLLDNEGIRWMAVDRFVAAKALEVSRVSRKRLAGADAVHLATAVISGADYFMAYDTGFPTGETIQGVKVIAPSVVWEEDLFEASSASGIGRLEAAADFTDASRTTRQLPSPGTTSRTP